MSVSLFRSDCTSDGCTVVQDDSTGVGWRTCQYTALSPGALARQVTNATCAPLALTLQEPVYKLFMFKMNEKYIFSLVWALEPDGSSRPEPYVLGSLLSVPFQSVDFTI